MHEFINRYPEIPGVAVPQQRPLQSNRPQQENNMNTVIPTATQGSDPPPVLSNNPPITAIVLYKEMSGYPAYGNPSGNADILYTGNRAVWTFDSPAFLFVPGNLSASLAISMVLDDHSNVPINQYSARITINGNVVHNGRLPLPHGVPVGGMFTNWREMTFNIPNVRRSNRIVIENTSSGDPNNWIAVDWMELRFVPR